MVCHHLPIVVFKDSLGVFLSLEVKVVDCFWISWRIITYTRNARCKRRPQVPIERPTDRYLQEQQSLVVRPPYYAYISGRLRIDNGDCTESITFIMNSLFLFFQTFVVVLLNKTIAFLTLSLPSPSSLLKLPVIETTTTTLFSEIVNEYWIKVNWKEHMKYFTQPAVSFS